MPDTLHIGRTSERVAALLLANDTDELYSSSSQVLDFASRADALRVAAMSSRFFYVRFADPTAERDGSSALDGAVSAASGAEAMAVWQEERVVRLAGEAERTERWLHLVAAHADQYEWQLRFAPLPAIASLAVSSVSSRTARVAWSAAGGADSAVDIEVRPRASGAGARWRVASSAWRGNNSFVLAELESATAYDVRVRAVRGVARGAPALESFTTLTAEADAALCAAQVPSAAQQAVCSDELRPRAVECAERAAGGACANGGVRDVTCACACANGFSGARCTECERECANGGASAVRGGACVCACRGGWSGAACGERALDAAGRSDVVQFAGDAVSLQVAFDAAGPRPDSIRLRRQPLTARNDSFFAFELDALFDGVQRSPSSISFELILRGYATDDLIVCPLQLSVCSLFLCLCSDAFLFSMQNRPKREKCDSFVV